MFQPRSVACESGYYSDHGQIRIVSVQPVTQLRRAATQIQHLRSVTAVHIGLYTMKSGGGSATAAQEAPKERIRYGGPGS